VKGFVIGTVKGISGLVIKPVVGFLDFHSKTSEGVKMAATDEQDIPNNERMRLPRAFYDI
jgi:vacuolar protein sorting-associated protein 13A/C